MQRGPSKMSVEEELSLFAQAEQEQATEECQEVLDQILLEEQLVQACLDWHTPGFLDGLDGALEHWLDEEPFDGYDDHAMHAELDRYEWWWDE